MNEFDLILSHSNVMLTITKLNNSIADIRNKFPNRVDLIESMTSTVGQLTESYVFYQALEKEYRMEKSRNTDLELILLQKEAELQGLRMANNELMKGL